jgi:5-methylcytosine-specific restriction protein B
LRHAPQILLNSAAHQPPASEHVTIHDELAIAVGVRLVARYGFDKNLPPIIEAAQNCVRRCLIDDGSVFSTGPLWTPAGFAALDKHFVRQPDAGDGSFYEKLMDQMTGAPAEAVQLMAEVLWLLMLFPSNISADTKRDNIVRVWSWSGRTLDTNHPMLADVVLDGIGSAGMGMNTNRWREVNYLVGMGALIKSVPRPDREAIFATYESFIRWISSVPMDGERQFRHMLRFFLFPDQVERMSSNRDRRTILAAFGVAPKQKVGAWSDEQLDEGLFKLRQTLEAEYKTEKLDFYVPPLRARWKTEGETEQPRHKAVPPRAERGVQDDTVRPAVRAARNLILYGPPGTGKTHRLRELFGKYTDDVIDVDRRSWEIALVSNHGWRAVIAAALAMLGGAARVGEIADHALVRAKADERQRSKNLLNTLWAALQNHTSLESKTVQLAARREPFLFDKEAGGVWRLLPEWKDRDPEAVELSSAWKAGPGGEQDPVRRYRVVTFHPSYSYEDFVIGLRPVSDDDGEASAATRFQLVDGAFKQLSQIARANPAKRYALFIDEINRANIAKVFGELITLIEPDKRAHYDTAGRLVDGMEVMLPGTSDERFGVPANLDIYGTMNTADRSIALLDIALRRRFEFEEMPPLYRVLDRSIEGVHLGKLLSTINDRLEYLIDRDHRIGHAYLIKVSTLDELRIAFERQIVPLLQEYFFDDWSRVAAVLTDGSGGSRFVRTDAQRALELFGRTSGEIESERLRFTLRPASEWDPGAFRSIYADSSSSDEADSSGLPES